MAVSNQLNSKEINIPNCDCEVLFVRNDNLLHKIIMLCCYYRPHNGDQISSFIESVNHVITQNSTDHLIIVGDMNFPGFGWSRDPVSIKHNTIQ